MRFVIAMLLLSLPSAGYAEKRIALLVGNQDYAPAIGALANPHKDVALLERTLRGLGFEVAVERDAGLAALTRAVNAYARRVREAGPGAVGFFYYSGHGAADGGINYLIPVDVKSAEDSELWDASLQLTTVTRQLRRDAANATHFVVFDACRNALKLKKSGSRALVQSKGFVPVSQEQGMLIAYATAEGELASDIGDSAGPYATVLAEEIAKPNVEAVAMFRRVQVRVRSTIGQEPWLGFSALGEVHLAGVRAETDRPAAVPQSPPSSSSLGEAAQAWAGVKDTTDIRTLEAFRRQYGASNPFYDRLAESRIEHLKAKEQVAVATPAPKPAGVADNTPARCDGVDVQVGNDRRCLKPNDAFKECADCPDMVVIPAGEFMMGSKQGGPDEQPVHKVAIALFAAGKYEVTFREWDACVAAGGCKHRPDDGNWGRGLYPVINVSWLDITNEYLPWLNRKTGKTYRLLTEAEWEYAARGETSASAWQRRYPWGDEISVNRANCIRCGSQWDGKQTAPVGSFRSNGFDLHDMHGNVWEWVQDCATATYANAASDGRASPEKESCPRMSRGGSWNTNPVILRSSFRVETHPARRQSDKGFRVARSLN